MSGEYTGGRGGRVVVMSGLFVGCSGEVVDETPEGLRVRIDGAADEVLFFDPRQLHREPEASEQPLPTNDEKSGPESWPAVVKDMEARHQLGIERYKSPLRPFNGRNSLQDLYEELLDATVYAKNEMLVRAEFRKSLEALIKHCEAAGELTRVEARPEIEAAKELLRRTEPTRG